MSARPRRRLFVLGLAVLLALVGPVLVPRIALAEGGGDPQILSPDGSDPLYTGYAGPIVVSFQFAPAGTYTYTVSLIPGGEDPPQPVGEPGEYVSDGGPDPVPLGIPALAAGRYQFDITDGDGHDASLLFTVRGPQPRCSVIMPSVVRVNAPEEIIAGRLGADCDHAGVTYASWDVRHVAQGFVNLMTFNGVTRDTWRFAAGEPLGRHYAVPVVADAPGDDVILQNVRATTIRLVSRLSLGARRDGRLVTLSGVLTRYTPSAFAFRGWRAQRVTVSYRTCGTCVWHRLASPTTSAKGRFAVKVRAGFRRYRVTAAGTGAVWAPATAYVRR